MFCAALVASNSRNKIYKDKPWSEKCGVGCVKCGVRSVQCGVKNVECTIDIGKAEESQKLKNVHWGA